MTLPTILVAAGIGAAWIAALVWMLCRRKKGGGCGSCCGDCSHCGGCSGSGNGNGNGSGCGDCSDCGEKKR